MPCCIASLMNKRAIKHLKMIGTLTLVAFCSLSTVALAEYLVLCEIGETVTAIRPIQGEVNGHSHDSEHSHSHGLTENQPEGHAPVSSNEEEECCDSISPIELSAQAYSPEICPLFLTALLSWTWTTVDPSILLRTSLIFRAVQMNAPPPFSLSHIPTTIFLI